MSVCDIPPVRLTFSWRAMNAKECYLAICAAVRFGFDTRETLLAALPQFSVNRLIVALDTLIAAEMAYINMGRLTIDKDMLIIEALAAGHPLDLPLEMQQLKRTPPLLNAILLSLGIKNPAGSLVLLKSRVEEIKDDL